MASALVLMIVLVFAIWQGSGAACAGAVLGRDLADGPSGQ
jgi:hypothetical protein